VGALLGDEVPFGGAGDLIVKPNKPVVHILERGRGAGSHPRGGREVPQADRFRG
jgi:hypothetical protein